MHQPHPHLTPTSYTNLYQDCINAGWDEHQLDAQLATAEHNARSPGYLAATLRTLRHEGPPAVVVDRSTTTTTGPRTIQTARINGQPGAGRRIHPHPYQGDGQDCAQCQLPRANTVHQAD